MNSYRSRLKVALIAKDLETLRVVVLDYEREDLPAISEYHQAKKFIIVLDLIAGERCVV